MYYTEREYGRKFSNKFLADSFLQCPVDIFTMIRWHCVNYALTMFRAFLVRSSQCPIDFDSTMLWHCINYPLMQLSYLRQTGPTIRIRYSLLNLGIRIRILIFNSWILINIMNTVWSGVSSYTAPCTRYPCHVPCMRMSRILTVIQHTEWPGGRGQSNLYLIFTMHPRSPKSFSKLINETLTIPHCWLRAVVILCTNGHYYP